MNEQQGSGPVERQFDRSRRRFLGGALGAAAAGPLLAAATALAAENPAAKAEPKRKIKLGLVGCGGRGSWLAGLFKQDGGYEMHAVADYFPDAADKCGDALGVAEGRRFSGLSGYKKLIDSGVEAVALEVPPYFFPEQAAAAVEAGVHVYMAKPVAVDVPGCLRIEAAGKRATQKQRVLLRRLPDAHRPVKYRGGQADPRRGDGPTGQDGHVRRSAAGTRSAQDGHHRKPACETALGQRRRPGRRLDRRLRHPRHRRRAVGCWASGPVAATGVSRICRPDPHGDSPRRLRSRLRVCR